MLTWSMALVLVSLLHSEYRNMWILCDFVLVHLGQQEVPGSLPALALTNMIEMWL